MRLDRRFPLALLACFVLAPAAARADTITVISQQYQLQGFAGISGTAINVSLDATSTSALHTNLSQSSLSPPGFFSVDLIAEGATTGDTAWINTKTDCFDTANGFTMCRAFATITFQPLTGQLLVSYIHNTIAPAVLFDETAQLAVLTATAFNPLPVSTMVFVNPTHVYSLHSEAGVGSSQIGVAAVPEASTLLMFSAAVGCVVLLRRRALVL